MSETLETPPAPEESDANADWDEPDPLPDEARDEPEPDEPGEEDG